MHAWIGVVCYCNTLMSIVFALLGGVEDGYERYGDSTSPRYSSPRRYRHRQSHTITACDAGATKTMQRRSKVPVNDGFHIPAGPLSSFARWNLPCNIENSQVVFPRPHESLQRFLGSFGAPHVPRHSVDRPSHFPFENQA